MTLRILTRLFVVAIFLVLTSGISYASVPISDGFDYPVGNRDNLEGWYTSLSLGDSWTDRNSKTYIGHLGEDYLKNSGSSKDEMVYSISNGVVYKIYTNSPDSWGGVVIIKHVSPNSNNFDLTGTTLPDSGEASTDVVYSLYAHLNLTEIYVHENDNVSRGTPIGKIGIVPNFPTPHLHFEIKNQTAIDTEWESGVGHGYSGTDNVAFNHYKPSMFVTLNRPQITPLIGDWDNNEIDTTGTFDPRTSMFSLDNGVNQQFGEPGDLPIVGDWNGDGSDTIGIYRPKAAEFHLDYDNNGQRDGNAINFGDIGDVPIVGNWDGDDDDDIGVFRPSNDTGITVFYFDSDRDRETDSNISFGMPTDVPIVGDWDNDGTDDIGVFRRNDPNTDPRYLNNAVFYLKNGAETIPIPYGNNSDIPIIGKPYPDERTRIGVYRPSTEEFIFNHDLLVEPNTNEGRSGGPDYFNYTFKDSNVDAGPTYDWIDITSTGTKILPNSDDYYVDQIPVGFFFNFYGTDYSLVSITNNGITLASGGTSQWDNQPIGESNPHNFIAPFWDDLVTWDGESADAVYYQTIGEAPNRKFIVEWHENHHYWHDSPNGITFEAILFEGSNNVLFQYKDVDFGIDDPINNGGEATVGIEGPDGQGLQYSFNEQAIEPEKAILFKFPQYAGTNLFLSEQTPASKDHGSSMTYMLYYHNFGNAAAQNVVLEDELSDDVEFESASEGGVYNSATGTVRWDIGSFASEGHGYRTLTVQIPQDVPVGTVISNDASISTSNTEVRIDDNEAHVQTRVTGSTLPPNVGVEPNNGGTGTPSIYWNNPIAFSYHSSDTATGVDIRIHVNDGGPDITGSMTPTTDSTTGGSDWTYTTTFYPRHGSAIVSYSIQSSNAPYSPGYDVRNSYGDFITANDIEAYIENNYPTSPMLDETNIGSSFINAGNAYGIDPAFLVAMAELEGRFGTQGWAASHPEAHNTFGWGVPSGSTPVDSVNSADSWGDMVNRVAERIANGPYYFNAGRYTIEQIRNVYAGDPNSQGIANLMNQLYTFSQNRHSTASFNIYIDPAGYIYDINTGERIAGASVWLQRPDGTGDWENVPTGESTPVAQPDVNPQVTGEDGMYQWDVLEGSYRVHVEAPGYEPANSIVVSVPPPVFDLHVGLISTAVPPTNAPPVADAGGPYNVDEASPVNFDASVSSDPDGDSLTYEWDFNNDGVFEVSSSEPYSTYTWDDDYTGTVSLRVTDEDGLSDIATAEVTVNNVAPIVDSGSDLIVTAGDLVSFSGTFSDSGWLDNHTAEWNLGEGTVKAGSVSEENENPDSTGTVSGNFSYFDAGEYTVTLSVTDDDGGIGEDQLTVTVLPIVATVDFDPDTLNLGSGGEWITAYIELPDGYDVAGIDASSVLLNGTVSAVTDPRYEFVTNESEYLQDFDGDLIIERMLKFDREEVEGILKAGDQVTVTFKGKVEYENEIDSGMASFEGSDVITVIEKDSKKDKPKK